MSDTPKVIPTAEHARNLEHQLAAARRERDEAKSKLDAYIKSEAEHTDALAQKSAEALEGINALAAERDRLREENKTLKETRQRTVEELVKTRPYLTLMSECNNLKSALATAREDFANFRANIRQALFSYWPNNLGNTDEEIVGAITRALTALATAQADIAKLCSVIAAAFAETTKPLNASVEYDARPTEGERLKKVQEILSSAIDAASATEAKRIPVKVRMAKDLGPDLWAIMAPNTPRFWVKKGDEVPVKCNQHGAMTLLTPHGELGVKPQECEIIEWQYPASATEGGQQVK